MSYYLLIGKEKLISIREIGFVCGWHISTFPPGRRRPLILLLIDFIKEFMGSIVGVMDKIYQHSYAMVKSLRQVVHYL